MWPAFRALDSWWLDVKLGIRMLIKYPGLTLVGGSGIAVAVAIAAGAFSVIYGNFLGVSLPIEEGDRIVSIEVWDTAASKAERRVLFDYQVWREELKSVQDSDGAGRRLEEHRREPLLQGARTARRRRCARHGHLSRDRERSHARQ